jgi:hypothetical protein
MENACLIAFSQIFEEKGKSVVTVTHSITRNYEKRVIAVDSNGNEREPHSGNTAGGGEFDQMVVSFDLKPSDISKFLFQIRPYEWVTFKNVSLQPLFKTDVKVQIGSDEKVDYSSVVVTEGVGFDDIIVGDFNCTGQFIKSRLGQPNDEVKDEKTGWWLNYTKTCGLDFWLNLKENILLEIRLNEGFKGKLTSGISLSSTKQDVFNTYGRPLEEKTVTDLTKHFDNQVLYQIKSKGLFRKVTNSKIFYRRHGLLFWFEGDKILQIVIHRKNVKTNMQVEVGQGRAEQGSVNSSMSRERYFVTLVVGLEKMMFEGQEVTWEQLPKILKKVPNRPKTVFCIAIDSEEITVAQLNQAKAKAEILSRQFGFEYLSYVGVHPLGSKTEGK